MEASFLTGANATFIAELYERYLDDPTSVDPSWVDLFKDLMDEFLRMLKATPPAPGHDQVLVAGQPEWETQQDRLANGIPIHKEVVEWFQEICSELAIPALV